MKTLFILLGPTGVGKTTLSIDIARNIGSPVISADSRQIYKEITIGTAKPSVEQLASVRHYFINKLLLTDYYSASLFEDEAIALIEKLHISYPNLLLCGGSMMYIDAVSKGIDEMPSVNTQIREKLWEQYHNEGLTPILEELKNADPFHYKEVDRMNHRRVIHAVEIYRMTGKPYSSFRTNKIKQRNFRIFKIGLTRERSELFERINKRVEEMISSGLIEEAKRVYPMRHLNALNTVGYKELFLYFEGKYALDQAIEKIKRNTRVYARKQMTWFKRDKDITWFNPDNKEDIYTYINNICHCTE